MLALADFAGVDFVVVALFAGAFFAGVDFAFRAFRFSFSSSSFFRSCGHYYWLFSSSVFAILGGVFREVPDFF